MGKSKALDNSLYQDFTFTGTKKRDNAGKVFNSTKAYPKFVTRIAEIADFVFSICTVNDLIPRHVMIVTHGSTTGFHVGRDYIDATTVETKHGDAFKKLGLLMMPSIATLELYSCQVGNNRSLLRTISLLLGGAPVMAYEENQPASGEGRGNAIWCQVDECKAVPKKPIH
jgi:hypothetical protein